MADVLRLFEVDLDRLDQTPSANVLCRAMLELESLFSAQSKVPAAVPGTKMLYNINSCVWFFHRICLCLGPFV